MVKDNCEKSDKDGSFASYSSGWLWGISVKDYSKVKESVYFAYFLSTWATNNIKWAEAGFIGTITVAYTWYINTYDDCQVFWKVMVLIIQQILRNIFSKKYN